MQFREMAAWHAWIEVMLAMVVKVQIARARWPGAGPTGLLAALPSRTIELIGPQRELFDELSLVDDTFSIASV
jgi:hypothetical protein